MLFILFSSPFILLLWHVTSSATGVGRLGHAGRPCSQHLASLFNLIFAKGFYNWGMWVWQCSVCSPPPALGLSGHRESLFSSPCEDAPCSHGALLSPCARAHPHPQFPFLPLPLSNPLAFKCHSQAAQAFRNNLPGVGAPSTAPSRSGASNSSWFASSGSSSLSPIP